jgi:tungstate transport system permease protein
MSQFLEAFPIALDLIFSGDRTVFAITLRTLAISCTSTALASVFCVPLACLLHFSSFRGKRLLVGVIHALYSLPTVFIGMLVFLLVSRAGPMGNLGLLFTPAAIVFGEMLLIAPIITGLTMTALKSTGKEVADTAVSLGAGKLQIVTRVLTESKHAVLTALLMGFGRAVSEVGVAIMVGGNIAGHTRTLTTAIALGVGRGEIAASIALGLILLTLALAVSFIVLFLQRDVQR